MRRSLCKGGLHIYHTAITSLWDSRMNRICLLVGIEKAKIDVQDLFTCEDRKKHTVFIDVMNLMTGSVYIWETQQLNDI